MAERNITDALSMDIWRRNQFWQKVLRTRLVECRRRGCGDEPPRLARSQTKWLWQVIDKFGIERVQNEWDILLDRFSAAYSVARISVCNRILAEIAHTHLS